MTPKFALAGLAMAAYAVWKAFKPGRDYSAGSHNNWRNPNHSAVADTGVWHPHTLQATNTDVAPMRNAGTGA